MGGLIVEAEQMHLPSERDLLAEKAFSISICCYRTWPVIKAPDDRMKSPSHDRKADLEIMRLQQRGPRIKLQQMANPA